MGKRSIILPIIVFIIGAVAVAGIVWFVMSRNGSGTILPAQGYVNGTEQPRENQPTVDLTQHELSFEWIVEPRYDHALGFVNGITPVLTGNVMIDGLWGFMNAAGEEIVPPRYTQVTFFNEGFATVNAGAERTDWGGLIGGQWGFVDETGREIVSPRYDSVSDFHGGISIVRTGGVLNEWGGFDGGQWGVVDTTGREVVPLIYDSIWHFSDGLAAIQTGGRPNEHGAMIGGQWGFVDKQGNVVVPPQFSLVNSFHGGFAAVAVGGTLGQWGYEGSLWGIIDTQGNVVVTPQYHAIGSFIDGFATVMDSNHLWGFIDTTGREIVSPQYNSIGFFSDGFAFVIRDDKWGFIDTAGNEVVPAIYSNFGTARYGMAEIHYGGEFIPYRGLTGGRSGIVNIATGEYVIQPEYDSVAIFGPNLIGVRVGATVHPEHGHLVGGYWGLRDATGREIIAPVFDSMFTMHMGSGDAPSNNNFVQVVRGSTVGEWGELRGGRVGLLNMQGEEVLPTDFANLWPTGNGLVQVMRGSGNLNEFGVDTQGRWGVTSETGEMLINPSYDMVRVLSPQIVAVGVNAQRDEWGNVMTATWGLRDILGREISPPRFDEISGYYNGAILLQYGGQWGIARIS
ncbi:MAG: WG repeat-containing protein [Defluviitaleaceae bacterium]|nr:WG repeat-containing protein [Defluviitaleaceae bacterium]